MLPTDIVPSQETPRASSSDVLLSTLAGGFVEFDPVKTIIDMPNGIIWMLVNFVPSVESLAKAPTILRQLFSTVLVSIAASCIAAVLRGASTTTYTRWGSSPIFVSRLPRCLKRWQPV
jgi:hypothetical protein